MANFYWYGGSGNWSDYTNHWSGNSGNSPADPKGNAPTSADNAIFDANSDSGSGFTVTIDAAGNCANLDFSATDQTPTLAGSSDISVYGNVVLVSGMTVSLTGNIYLKATSGTKTFTSNGVSIKKI